MRTRKPTETDDLPWGFFDQSICAAGALPVAEEGQSRLWGLDEVTQSYIQGAEQIVRDINILKSLIGELRSAAGIDKCNEDQAEAEEQIEEVLEWLVRSEELIRESEQIICDLTFVGLDESEALEKFTRVPGEFAHDC